MLNQMAQKSRRSRFRNMTWATAVTPSVMVFSCLIFLVLQEEVKELSGREAEAKTCDNGRGTKAG